MGGEEGDQLGEEGGFGVEDGVGLDGGAVVVGCDGEEAGQVVDGDDGQEGAPGAGQQGEAAAVELADQLGQAEVLAGLAGA